VQAMAARVQLVLDVLEQEGRRGRRRPGGVLVGFVDVRVDERIPGSLNPPMAGLAV
jgi:hypothetical protein